PPTHHSRLTSLSFSSLRRHLPTSPLFPYTTLFRSLTDCVPSKSLIATSTRTTYVREADRLGIHVHAPQDDGAVVDVHLNEVNSRDRKSTRLNSSHVSISYAVFCLKNDTYQLDYRSR